MKTPILELIEYTDPYCTWCWGSEPILRKIEEVYGSQVKLRFIMGGLVADMSNFRDPANRIGGPQWYSQVAAHWLEASRRHGMPVDEQIFFDLKDVKFSTYPASIAYKAAQFQDEALANRFLRRMREGAAAERRAIHLPAVQIDLAETVGLDSQQLAADIESGKAGKAFEEDLKECRHRGIHGFPSFLIRNLRNNEEVVLQGYHHFSRFEDTFQKLTGDAIRSDFPSAGRETIFALIKKYKKVAPREIAEAFSISEKDIEDHLSPFLINGTLRKKKAGNGFFILYGED